MPCSVCILHLVPYLWCNRPPFTPDLYILGVCGPAVDVLAGLGSGLYVLGVYDSTVDVLAVLDFELYVLGGCDPAVGVPVFRVRNVATLSFAG